MGEAAMSLGEQDLERIGEYVRTQLPTWIAQTPSLRPAGETVLLERMVRVEEAILNTQQLMRAEFKAAEKRFEAVDKRFEAVEKRFEAVDKRFEDLVQHMDKRFDAVDKRFDDLIHTMDKRFEAVDKRFEDLVHVMDTRFQAVDKRFEASDLRFADMQQSFNTRSAEIQQSFNDRFADMQQSFKRTQWFIGAATLLLTTVMSLYRFVG